MDCAAHGGSGSTVLFFCVPSGVPGLLKSVRDAVDSLPAAGDVVLPGMSLVMCAGMAAVPVCLPAVGGAVPPVVFAGGGGGSMLL